MEAKRIRPMERLNPLFNAEDKRRAEQKGEAYAVTPCIKLAVGTIVEGPAALQLCFEANPYAVPHDAECKAAFQEIIKKPEWQNRMRKMRELAQPENLKNLSDGMKQVVKAWAGSDLQKHVDDKGGKKDK